MAVNFGPQLQVRLEKGINTQFEFSTPKSFFYFLAFETKRYQPTDWLTD